MRHGIGQLDSDRNQEIPIVKKIDVPALLRKIAHIIDWPAEYVLENGAELVVRWWRLHVDVDSQYRLGDNDLWLPGIAVWGCDPQGRFGQSRLRCFDEVTTSAIDLLRVDAFLNMFTDTRREFEDKQNTRRVKRQGKTAKTAGTVPPNANKKPTATALPIMSLRQSRSDASRNGTGGDGADRISIVR